MNALEAALALLAAASTALERHASPTLQDVEDATEKAAQATKLLKSAGALLDEGIYTVAKEPAPLGSPLFGEDK